MSAWDRIHKWINDNAEPLAEGLSEPATDEGFAAAEKHLGVSFPESFKAIYRVHDGEKDEQGVLGGREFLSLERIVDEWDVWKGLLDGGDFEGAPGEPSGPCKSDWWNPKWIPITYDGAGNHHCLDLDPADGGTVGQIIDFWHDDASRTVVAASLEEFLDSYATALEEGRYSWDGDYLEEND